VGGRVLRLGPQDGYRPSLLDAVTPAKGQPEERGNGEGRREPAEKCETDE
jgi:hypothetical protein